MLKAAHDAGRCSFGAHADLADKAGSRASSSRLAHQVVVYSKRPFAGPGAGAGLSGALHPPRRDLQSSGLIAADQQGVTFKYKDYWTEGPGRYKTMTVAPGEFIRRFMLHVLAEGVPSHPPTNTVKHMIYRRLFCG